MLVVAEVRPRRTYHIRYMVDLNSYVGYMYCSCNEEVPVNTPVILYIVDDPSDSDSTGPNVEIEFRNPENMGMRHEDPACEYFEQLMLPQEQENALLALKTLTEDSTFEIWFAIESLLTRAYIAGRERERAGNFPRGTTHTDLRDE
jgi:hypothetical protein